MAYTLHIEWADGTFDEKPTSKFSNKRTALRVGKIVAADSHADAMARILICIDGQDTVAAFKVH